MPILTLKLGTERQAMQDRIIQNKARKLNMCDIMSRKASELKINSPCILSAFFLIACN